MGIWGNITIRSTTKREALAQLVHNIWRNTGRPSVRCVSVFGLSGPSTTKVSTPLPPR